MIEFHTEKKDPLKQREFHLCRESKRKNRDLRTLFSKNCILTVKELGFVIKKLTLRFRSKALKPKTFLVSKKIFLMFLI